MFELCSHNVGGTNNHTNTRHNILSALSTNSIKERTFKIFSCFRARQRIVHTTICGRSGHSSGQLVRHYLGIRCHSAVAVFGHGVSEATVPVLGDFADPGPGGQSRLERRRSGGISWKRLPGSASHAQAPEVEVQAQRGVPTADTRRHRR